MVAFAEVRPVRYILLGTVLLGLGAPAALARAQDDELEAVSQPVVQPLPGGPGLRLNAALTRLSRNARDVDALIEAGQAAAAIGDAEAALGFYRRADQLRPGNANIKAGLAGAMVLGDDPYGAIPLFLEAERLGPIDPALLAERGLAYDLVGDNETAQRYYRQALAAGPNDEVLRRLALSQAMAGDKRGMEITLSPLLQKQDKAAWRTRAFAFAILGQQAEAEAIARANLPEAAAETMVSYLRFMPRLTPAQQAAAANLGHFPRAADIGRDDPRVAAFARPKAVLAVAAQPAVAAPPPDRRERPSRQPRTRSAVSGTIVASRAPEPRPAPPEPQPERVAIAAPVATTVAAAVPAPAPAPLPAQPPAPRPAPAPARVAVVTPPAVQPGFDLRSAALPTQAAPTPAPVPAPAATSLSTPASPAAPSPASGPAHAAVQNPVQAPAAPAPPPAPAPARPRSLTDVFADLAPPSREVAPAAGAVDVRRIVPVTPAAKEEPAARARDSKSPAASQPSRIWVQIAASRNKAGLADDFRRFARQEPDLFKGRKGFTSPWGQATRLLTGPFDSDKAANAFVAQLKKAGIDGVFAWTSPAGQVVDPLPAAR